MSIKHKGETVLQNFVNIPITSTINASSTNEECASAKAVYDIVPTDTHIKEISLLGEPVADTTKYGDDILYFPCGVYIFESNAIANNFTNAPVKQAGTFYVTSIVPNKNMNTDEYVYRNYRYETYYGVIYTRSVMTGTLSEGIKRDSGWERTCKTKVADVSTKIVDIINISTITTNATEISVINGTCFVKLEFGCNVTSATPVSWVAITNDVLPTCKATQKFSISCLPSGISVVGTIDVNSNNIKIYGTIPSGTTGLYGGISYPVATA